MSHIGILQLALHFGSCSFEVKAFLCPSSPSPAHTASPPGQPLAQAASRIRQQRSRSTAEKECRNWQLYCLEPRENRWRKVVENCKDYASTGNFKCRVLAELA